MAEGGHSYNDNGNSPSFNSCPNNFPEQDFASTIPASVEEGDGSSSAATVLEDIVDEVVSLFADQLSVSNNNNNSSGIDNSNADYVEDVMKLLLNGSGHVVHPVEDEEKAGSTDLVDDLGNYLLPDVSSVNDSVGSGNSSHSLFDGSDGCYYYEDGAFDGAHSLGTSSCGSATEDATCALTMMQILVDENKHLRQMIGKSKRITALLMSKYRKSMAFMLNELDIYKNDFREMVKMVQARGQNYDHKNDVQKLRETIIEMKQVMFLAAQLDDQAMNAYEERIEQLRFENQGLHRMIQIALDYGGEHLLTYKDKLVQTEDSPKQGNVEKEVELAVPISNENVDVYLASHDDLEREDDLDESFYTANSFNGSVSSLNQEPDGDSDADQTIVPVSPETVVLPEIVTTMPKVGDHDKVGFNVEEE